MISPCLPLMYPETESPPEHLSGSSIKDYLGCSLRYFFGRVCKLPEAPSPALHLGKAVHAGLQAFHLAKWRGGDTSPEAILSAYDNAFEELEESDGPVDFGGSGKREALFEKGRLMMGAYLKSEHAHAPEKTVGVETRLEEPLFPDDPVPFKGYVDLVRQNDEGLVLVDFKTVANQPDLEAEAFQHELQMGLYQDLIEKASGMPVVRREIVFLTKHKEPRIVILRQPPASSTALQRVFSMSQYAWNGIQERRWGPQPGMHCAWCSFRSQCLEWTGGAP